ncbi:MAG TPA: hypothetical protein VKC60_01045 [Opitutaceae bacterium]|nr:hypothetical protein [Opitutaceae bacterium]
MPALSFLPAISLLTLASNLPAALPLRTLFRTAEYKLRPPRPLRFQPQVSAAQDRVLGQGIAGPHQRADIAWEERKGSVPTIVVGGFVPDATEAVYLMRGYLLRQGSLFYFNYPRHGFSAELIFAQLDDLVEELTGTYGQPPVILSVSFGSGVVLEWLKRRSHKGRSPELAGLMMVSPVLCVEDLLTPGEPKPTTLLGRAVKPYLDAKGAVSSAIVEKSRTIFAKMFEAGAQNKDALRLIMTRGELSRLKDAVISTINGIDATGATERVQALSDFSPLSSEHGVLCDAPTLIMFAEKEGAVITEGSPSMATLQSSPRTYFPQAHCKVVSNSQGSPVQHASLIFHCFNFLIPIAGFYRNVKIQRARRAA